MLTMLLNFQIYHRKNQKISFKETIKYCMVFSRLETAGSLYNCEVRLVVSIILHKVLVHNFEADSRVSLMLSMLERYVASIDKNWPKNVIFF